MQNSRKRLLLPAFLFLAGTLLACLNAQAQQAALGIFTGHNDIGPVLHPGKAVYNAQQQSYEISGSGSNMWFDKDEGHFVWRKLKGDFILTTHANLLGKGTDPHRKLGWMIRTSLDPGSPHVNVSVHGDGLAALQFRRNAGGNTEEKRSTVNAPEVIQLSRKGNRYTMSVARFGDTFTREELTGVDLGDEVYVGLFVCSHHKDVVEKAAFRNVRIEIPARDNLVPYREYIGSHLEVMDVASGNRQILYTVPGSIQAPNWTTDGKALLYNGDGLMYRFDLAKKTPAVLNTGFANKNNNDHVLSFDGKMLGISHHSAEDKGQSIVYTLPASGGTPKKITPLGPSYLHGWSPDGKELLYTGGRQDEYDIYKISAKGGNEINLTKSKGLDDGPEYTPDGKYIYFNSVRTGKMQIWRMRPDGSQPEQVTNDEYNNWFPHISPDGKWIVYLAFPPDINPSDHPFYKHVYLRLMPITGGPAKVIAYLYGGQGTINVPSWSPDSKKIAFISNSDVSALK